MDRVDRDQAWFAFGVEREAAPRPVFRMIELQVALAVVALESLGHGWLPGMGPKSPAPKHRGQGTLSTVSIAAMVRGVAAVVSS